MGTDCNIVLDGVGYFVKPGSMVVKRPRVRGATGNADGSMSYVDGGPGKARYEFTVYGKRGMRDFLGRPVETTPAAYRGSLLASYAKLNTELGFVPPWGGAAISVRFDGLGERVLDPITGEWEWVVELVEA